VKAGVLKAVGDLRLMNAPEPVLEPGDMLIKVRAATICGTDLRILRGEKTAGIRYPSIIGHEFSGIVADAGGHAGFSVGDAVCVCPAYACGRCDNCLRDAENLCRNLVATGYQIDGAFAEYIRVPGFAVGSGHVFAKPEALSFEAAALAEPLACVMQGQAQANVHRGDVVVVLGAGPIGLLHVKLARASGAKTIIVSQRSAMRRDAALKAGADIVVDPMNEDVFAIVRAATGGLGADVVIVAIGAPSLANDAIRLARQRGRVNLFAGFPKNAQVALDVNAIHYNEIAVTGTFGLKRSLYKRALDIMARGEIEVESLLTHRFALDEIEDAFRVAGDGTALKVAVVG
jgi:L-iditol 2-dehydrogenase